MDMAMCFVTMSAICAIFCILQAVERRREKRIGAGGRTGIQWKGNVTPRSFARGLRWIDAAEFAQLTACNPDLIIFHLIQCNTPNGRSRWLPGELVVTLDQLEQTLLWIPLGTKFAIYRPQGIGVGLARKLSAIASGREALVLAGALSQGGGQFGEMAGEPCS
jgi:hypothetical protein